MKKYKMFIGGNWVDSVSGEMFDDFNPYNGEVYAQVPKANAKDADLVMAAAFEARKGWAATPPAERAKLMNKAAQIMEENMMDIAQVLIDEGGSTFGKAMFEISQTVDLIYTAAGDGKHILGETFHTDPSSLSMSFRKPRGTIVCISPWNFPLILSMYKVAYGLATGNTIVLKPASETPVIGLKIAEVFEKAGIPAGVLNVITGPGSVLGDALIDDKRCSFVAITGETQTGRRVAQRAAANLKEYYLELGGKNPIVVLADADIDYAVKVAAFSAYLHQGEICMSADRIIVEKPIVEEFTRKLTELASSLPVGDPNIPTNFIGPIISDKQIKSIHAHVQDAVSKGAKLLTGGTYEGRLYKPTLLTNVTPDMKIYYEETFGPVASIIAVNDVNEALEVANDTTYGLSAGIITNDYEKALFLAENIDAGMVHVNGSSVDADAACPFGGMKESGQGREGGQHSIQELTEIKWVTMAKQKKQYPL
ncbi:MAG: aldehyde dehydrogenase family protein [Bacillota bacterium]